MKELLSRHKPIKSTILTFEVRGESTTVNCISMSTHQLCFETPSLHMTGEIINAVMTSIAPVSKQERNINIKLKVHSSMSVDAKYLTTAEIIS